MDLLAIPGIKLVWAVGSTAATDLSATWEMKEQRDISACSWSKGPGHATSLAAWKEEAESEKARGRDKDTERSRYTQRAFESRPYASSEENYPEIERESPTGVWPLRASLCTQRLYSNTPGLIIVLDLDQTLLEGRMDLKIYNRVRKI